jgi:hypothetical protein
MTEQTQPSAALASSPAQGWMTIDSAPKDRTPVIVWWDDRTVGEARYIPEGDAHDYGWWWANTDPGDYFSERLSPEPSHWMPLPAPPNVAASPSALPAQQEGAQSSLAELDAKRYRWLRGKAKRTGRDGGWWGFYELPHVPAWDGTPYALERGKGYGHESLDAAIDAAIAAQENPHD